MLLNILETIEYVLPVYHDREECDVYVFGMLYRNPIVLRGIRCICGDCNMWLWYPVCLDLGRQPSFFHVVTFSDRIHRTLDTFEQWLNSIHEDERKDNWRRALWLLHLKSKDHLLRIRQTWLKCFGFSLWLSIYKERRSRDFQYFNDKQKFKDKHSKSNIQEQTFKVKSSRTNVFVTI